MQRRGKRPDQSWLTRLRETIARATRLISSTNPVSTSAPAQAISCHDVYGLPANWYITTGTLAIGPVTSALQYWLDRKSTTSELQSLMRISYAVFCLKKKNNNNNKNKNTHKHGNNTVTRTNTAM